MIDPILAATFLGGSESEQGATALALDSMGNVYVAGDTDSADFPGVGPGSADNSFDAFMEAFVAKLDGELSTILAATFLGGSGTDDSSALALDSTGNVFVAGLTTSPNFPGVGPGSADNTLAEFDTEAFVAKLDPNLSGPPVTAEQCMGRSVTLLGAVGNDVLTGTPGADVIDGLEGRDHISGLGGNDIICGGLGNDKGAGVRRSAYPAYRGANSRRHALQARSKNCVRELKLAPLSRTSAFKRKALKFLFFAF